jgi:hypothetical protein
MLPSNMNPHNNGLEPSFGEDPSNTGFLKLLPRKNNKNNNTSGWV